MRLLLDECIPRPLLRDLSTHDAHHVVDMGWSSKRNGELLKLMLADRFDIGVVVVLALTNRVKELRPLIPKILEALGAVKPGALVKVGG
jgi:hypothetical protein